LSFLDIGTFLLGNLAALLLRNITTFLFRDITAFFRRNLSALFRVMDLLTDLLVDSVTLLGVDSITLLGINSVAFLGIDGVALTLRNILAFLFGDSRTFSLIDHRTLLLRNILADLILDSFTLPVIDDLALGHGVGGALLLSHGLALSLIPGGTGLGSLSGARFLVSSLLYSSGDVDTLQLLRVVAVLLMHGGTLLAASLAVEQSLLI